jgi:hypothetical protein
MNLWDAFFSGIYDGILTGFISVLVFPFLVVVSYVKMIISYSSDKDMFSAHNLFLYLKLYLCLSSLKNIKLIFKIFLF